MTNAELVEKIRRILDDSESVSDEEQKETARLYASRLKRIENGFRRATARLNCGAVSDADWILVDDSLLEDYTTLSFPDAEIWQQVCRTFDYDIAPTLDQATRDRLAAFEIEYSTVRDAFARYRRLVMENAPSRSQLEVLYYLIEHFGDQDYLIRQVERLEKRRNAELADLSRQLNENVALDVDFDALESEFQSRRLVPVPAETLTVYRSWSAYAQGRQEHGYLLDLIERWKGAVSANDVDEILQMLAEYRRGSFEHAASEIQQDELDELTQLFNYSCSIEKSEKLKVDARGKAENLRRALARPSAADLDKISNLYQEATIASNNAGASIPYDVEKDYQRFVRDVESQARRRRVTVVSFVAVVIVFFTVLSILSVSHSRNLRDARGAAEAISAQLDLFEKHASGSSAALESAGKLVNQYMEERPKFEDVPEYAAVVERYNNIVSEEKQRQREIEDAVDAIESAHAAGKANPTGLERLRKLLLNDQEKERWEYPRLFLEDNALRREKNAAEADRYSSLLDELTAKTRAIDEDTSLSEVDTKKIFADVRTGLETLQSYERSGDVAPPLKRAREALEVALVGAERRFNVRSALNKHGQELTRAVGSVANYTTTLKAIKNAVGTTPAETPAAEGDDDAGDVEGLVLAINAALDDVANATNAEAWNRFAQSYDSVNATLRTRATSESSGAALKSSALAFAPEYAAFSSTRELFTDFASSGGYSGSANLLMKELEEYSLPTWVFFDADDSRYFYLTSNPLEDKTNLKYTTTADGQKTYDFNVDHFDETALDSAHPSVAYMLAKQATEKFERDASPEDWIAFMESALMALSTAPESALDPVMRLKLLAIIADASNSYPGFESLEKWIDDVRRTDDFDFTVNAYQPGKPLLVQREEARKALRDAPDLLQTLAAAKTAFEKGEASSSAQYRWVGFLDERNGEAVLVVGSGKTVPENATLWIARGVAATAEQVGVMTNSGASFTRGHDWSEYRWTPVYARSE